MTHVIMSLPFIGQSPSSDVHFASLELVFRLDGGSRGHGVTQVIFDFRSSWRLQHQ